MLRDTLSSHVAPHCGHFERCFQEGVWFILINLRVCPAVLW